MANQGAGAFYAGSRLRRWRCENLPQRTLRVF
jgi:hypothetical protein